MVKRLLCGILISASSGIILASPAHSAPEGDELPVCTGYDPLTGGWNFVQVGMGSRESNCPPGYAMFSFGPVSARWWWSMEQIPIIGHCCALPRGALIDEHTYERERCPDGAVVTGGKAFESKRHGFDYLLRCTRLNQTRFFLGTELPGRRMGWGEEALAGIVFRVAGVHERFTTWNRIPAGLRYGIFRTSETTSDSDGCLGYPWGAIFVGRVGRACSRLFFKQLMTHDGSVSRIVPTYPSCDVDNPFGADAHCASGESSE